MRPAPGASFDGSKMPNPARAQKMDNGTHLNEPIEPMTLGNMRENGVRSLGDISEDFDIA